MPRMQPPKSGVTVRMYRHGHGDCFLLATRKADGKPCYVLIDCGMKKKSEIKPNNTIDKIIEDIGTSTGNRIDVVLITHEHEDHVNGFVAKPPLARTRKCWDPIRVDELWLAWTEDGDDPFANQLRERFDDTLLGLMGAAEKLALAGNGADALQQITDLLHFETGEDDDPVDSLRRKAEELRAADATLSESMAVALALRGRTNKEAIRYMREKAASAPRFLRPDRGPYTLPGVGGLRIFALGPPRDEQLLLSLDPHAAEEFRLDFRLEGASRSFFKAVQPGRVNRAANGPFSVRHGVSLEGPEVPLADDANDAVREFLLSHYGAAGTQHPEAWRRIDGDWLDPSEQLALRLNSEVNNTSLVIAVELQETGKVLLFTGDAQRGSWISWSDLSWETGPGEITAARDLLARTVLYKVGHHGSHNATLKGTLADDYANLGWMAEGRFRDEFVAMIPSNEDWARDRRPFPWRHPLAAIEAALMERARGRVFQTNKDKVTKPDHVSATEWRNFTNRTQITDLYFDCTVADK